MPETDEEPEITDLDERWREELFSQASFGEETSSPNVAPPLSHELQTFVGNKRHKVWIWLQLAQKNEGSRVLSYLLVSRVVCVDGCPPAFKPHLGTAVNHWLPGIIAWTIGERSSLTFQLLWVVVK